MAKDILEEIVAYKRIEVEMQKSKIPPSQLYNKVEKMLKKDTYQHYSIKDALVHSASGIIAEFKRKSPSKDWIKEDGKPEIIPESYFNNGASAISILTDEKYFGGNMDFIRIARQKVACPILRKDFIIDEYQLFQAYEIGADAVLLIAADLNKEECSQLATTAHELGLETLLEIHSEPELDYINDNIDMVGVNNRNLGSFTTNIENSYHLASQLPDNYVLVSESGISNPNTVRELREVGYRGFLIGETFMKTDNPGETLAQFIRDVIKQ